MTPRQNEIASLAIADIVRDALSGSEKPSASEIKQLAEDAAVAIRAGFEKLEQSAT